MENSRRYIAPILLRQMEWISISIELKLGFLETEFSIRVICLTCSIFDTSGHHGGWNIFYILYLIFKRLQKGKEEVLNSIGFFLHVTI